MSDISQNATRYDTSNTQRVDTIVKNNGQVYSGSGNTTKIGFDCSGYFYHVMRESGYGIERLTASGYQKSNKFYDVSSSNIRPGDMINFGNHIGIVTSYDPETGLGKFKHMRGSNNKGSLKESEFSTNPEIPRYYGTNRPIKAIRRVNEDNYDPDLDLHKNGDNPQPVLQPIPQNYDKQCELQEKLNSRADNSPDNNSECVQAIREQTGVAIDEWSTTLSGIGDEYVTQLSQLQVWM